MLNILSIDGGGGRGVMEAMILDDIMRMVTLMITEPQPELAEIIETTNDEARKSLYQNPSNHLTEEKRLGFRGKLEKFKEEDVIHPTEIFDMIAGTSTGSLMAFALLGGNKILNRGESQSHTMSLKDIIEMYKTATPKIFDPEHGESDGLNNRIDRWKTKTATRKRQDKRYCGIFS